MSKSIHNPGDEKTGIYPFVSENVSPDGKPMVIKSHKHRKELMKQFGLYDDKVSPETMKKRRRWYVEEEKEKRQEVLKDTWKDARTNKIDLRPFDLARRKAQYELRNFGKTGG